MFGRENVGMSNPKLGEKPNPRKSQVSAAMAIIRGLGGPKAMEKSAADGQLVNIPARRHVSDGGTEDISRSALMVWHRWLKDRCTGKSVQLALMRNSEQALGQVFTWPSSVKRLPRKTSKD